MKVTFHGGKELEEALMELKTTARKSLARRVLKRAAQLFANAANKSAPRGTGTPSLAGSYGVGMRLTRRQAAKARRAGRDQVFMHAGTADPAGLQQEFGNSIHGPQPHARVAFDETATPMLAQIQNDMAIDVEKATARARRKAERDAKKLS